MISDHLKLVENVPEGTAFCFDGKTKKQKIDQNDIIRELSTWAWAAAIMPRW